MLFARARCLVVLGLTLFGACGGSSEAASTRREVSGHVRDARSGSGIAGASIELVSDALDKAETVTDDDGHFSVALDVSDEIAFGHVTASHRDYEPAAAMSVYFDGTQHVIDFELQRSAGK